MKDKNFFVKLGTKLIPGMVTDIKYLVDVNTGEHRKVETLKKNEIAVCEIVLAENIVLDSFNKHKTLGELILIDRVTNMTSACGVVETVRPPKDNVLSEVTGETRARQKGQTPFVIVVETEEKAQEVEKKLILNGRHTMLLGEESCGQIPFAVKLLHEAGLIVIVERTLLDDASIEQIKSIVKADRFRELKEGNEDLSAIL